MRRSAEGAVAIPPAFAVKTGYLATKGERLAALPSTRGLLGRAI